MARKQHRSPETSSMYPSKHLEVSRLLEEDNLIFTFHNSDDNTGYTKSRDSAVMGRFVCHNPKCGANGWSSKRIPIIVRMYSGRRYNARVYHQRCRNCGNLSKPILDDTYQERVAYWLKTWCGIRLETPSHSEKKTKPHEKKFCEGVSDPRSRLLRSAGTTEPAFLPGLAGGRELLKTLQLTLNAELTSSIIV